MGTTRRCVSALALAVALVVAGPRAWAEQEPLHVHMVSASAEYESEPSLHALGQLLEQSEAVEVTVTASWGEDGGDDLPNIAALADADLLIVFARRMELPEEQLAVIRNHFEANKPAVGIRTSSHAFQDYLEMDAEIFGGDYSGHGGDEPIAVRVAEGASDHPIVAGMENWTRPGKMYENPELGPETQVLLHGEGKESGMDEPLAWTNRYGDGGRAFYTSMGMPHDFEDEQFVRMLLRAIGWTTERELDVD